MSHRKSLTLGAQQCAVGQTFCTTCTKSKLLNIFTNKYFRDFVTVF